MLKFVGLRLATLALLLRGFSGAVSAQTFRGNLQHTGEYGGSGVTQFSKVKWKFPTHGQVVSSPAIAAGTASFGSTAGMFYGVDLERGTLKWKFATHVRITSSPAVDAGSVYLES